nr:hypothetical protein [Tanacetum cinerariifolium]
MDAKSAFISRRIEEEVYVCQPPGFEDLNHPNKVYKVVKALYGLHQAPRAYEAKKDGIFISQDKYVTKVLRKFNFLNVMSANTPVDTEKTLVKDADGADEDVHLYRSMIGSLMYLTTSRLDIMYAVYVCARFQVTPKGKKQTVVATSTTEAEYMATASCCGQIQALVDKKKVIIPETSVRSDLHLEDVEDEHVTTTSNDPLLSGEDRLKLTELMELCTRLKSRVVALETTKANQVLEIRSLKRRVKKLDKKAKKKTHKLKRLYKIGVALVDETQGRNDQDVFDTRILDGEETSKPKAKGILIQEPSEVPTPTPIDSSQPPSKVKDKGKGKAKIIDPKNPLKKRDQSMIDEEVSRNLEAQMQAELEEERLARQKEEEEANIALIESWDKTQAMMDADYELAVKLKEEERGDVTIEEKSRLFVELIDKRKKYLQDLELKRSKNMVHYLLVKKMYPFTRNILHQMWNDVRLQVEYEVEMAYDLLRLIRRQISKGYVPE